MTDKKPDCYNCKWRGTIPGDRHSCCRHPNNKEMLENPFLSLMSILGSARKLDMGQPTTGLNIQGNEHGIRSGWFNWPFNFDPVWLENCDGFEQK